MGYTPKPLFWVGSSLGDLQNCPDDVQDVIGYAFHQSWLAEPSQEKL